MTHMATPNPLLPASSRTSLRHFETLFAQGEAIDGALEGEDDESRIDTEVAMVIAELGIGLSTGEPVPKTKAPAQAAGAAADDLEKRLEDLRKGDL
jgi:hypothetical protein